MRLSRFAAIATVIVLAACGGADQQAADTAAADTSAAAPSPAATAPTTGTATAAPVTGTTHEVRMVGDATGYRFEPANITVKAGDAIRFINVNGFPHNVAFDPATIPAAGRAQLTANMPDQVSELSSRMFTQPNETITISFGNVAAGQYPYHCTPHLAMGMRGVITVQ